jgi:hypothetical protein
MGKKEKKSMWTLCDVCVLVGFITLMASVAQPPVTQAIEEKQLTDMADRLHTVRSQIRLYKADTGLFPGQQYDGDRTVTSAEFIEALTDWQADENELYQQAFPANPYVSDAAAGSRITCVSDPDAEPAGTEETGWWFNAATGEFYACDSAFHTNY